MTFAQRLEKAMTQRKLSQAKLAEMIGVSQPTVSGWRRGAQPKLTHYERLVVALPEVAA